MVAHIPTSMKVEQLEYACGEKEGLPREKPNVPSSSAMAALLCTSIYIRQVECALFVFASFA